ncbi:hypothetical protein M3899_003223 [Vibrio parahaemolyticus]|nr:hypothetical protein [Vibrio parahaemolyticus]
MACKFNLLADINGSSGVLIRAQSSGLPIYKRLNSNELTALLDLIAQYNQNGELNWLVDCYTDVHGHIGEFKKPLQCPERNEASFRYYVVVDSATIRQLKSTV